MIQIANEAERISIKTPQNYNIITIFCVLYIFLHYFILAFILKTYNASFLDEVSLIFLAPFSMLYIVKRKELALSFLFFGYLLSLFAGAINSEVSGIPQPISALISILLDLKIFIFTFGISFFLDRSNYIYYIFYCVFITFISVLIVNVPVVFYEILTGNSLLTGYALSFKSAFPLPQSLTRHNTELAWLSTIALFSSLSLYIMYHKYRYIFLSLISFLMVLFSFSIKEMVGAIIGIMIISRPKKNSGILLFLYSVVSIFSIIIIIPNTDVGQAVLRHVGMFVGENAIPTVRLGMTEASWRIANDYFPFGSGGGTFGSAPSYQSGYSNIYYIYGIYRLWGGSPEYPVFLQDVFWPKILGEGGWIGGILYISFMIILFLRISLVNAPLDKYSEAIRRFCMSCTIMIFIVSMASAPYTNELLLFVTSLCFAYGCVLNIYCRNYNEYARGGQRTWS